MNRKNASNPPYPFRGGAKGYSGIEEDMVCRLSLNYIYLINFNLFVE